MAAQNAACGAAMVSAVAETGPGDAAAEQAEEAEEEQAEDDQTVTVPADVD